MFSLRIVKTGTDKDLYLGARSFRDSAPLCGDDDTVTGLNPSFRNQPVALEKGPVLDEACECLIAAASL